MAGAQSSTAAAGIPFPQHFRGIQIPLGSGSFRKAREQPPGRAGPVPAASARSPRSVSCERVTGQALSSLINNPGVMGHLSAEIINNSERSWHIRPLAGAAPCFPQPRAHRKSSSCFLPIPEQGQPRREVPSRETRSAAQVEQLRGVPGVRRMSGATSQARGSFHLPLPRGQRLAQHPRLLKVPSPPLNGSSPRGGSFKRQ